MYIIVIYRSGKTINGLSPDAMLLFIGTFVIITGFYAGLFMMNFFALRDQIGSGNLDLLITKPVSLQFIMTLRRSDAGILAVDPGNTLYIIWGILAPFLFLAITRLFWSVAVKNYSSASS